MCTKPRPAWGPKAQCAEEKRPEGEDSMSQKVLWGKEGEQRPVEQEDSKFLPGLQVATGSSSPETTPQSGHLEVTGSSTSD